MNDVRRAVWVVALSLASLAPALAQVQTGSILVRATDDRGRGAGRGRDHLQPRAGRRAH